MKKFWTNYKLSIISFLLAATALSMVQLKVGNKMILAERFMTGAGWIEIVALAFYAAVVVNKMKVPGLSGRWRRISWTVFMIVFFGQLLLGIAGVDKCLMTGELHFPIPAMIVGGAVYRLKFSFMPILFLSTIILTGPAWCSQLCYFGAMDNLVASTGKAKAKKLRFKGPLKNAMLFIVVLTAIMLRIFNVSELYTLIIASSLGIIGLLVIIIFSSKKKKMVHCVSYCPIGALIAYLKFVSPFRIRIGAGCTDCMICSSSCRYDALGVTDIKNKKPALSCTYCGDCLSSCKFNSIEYRFLGLSAENARNLYLVLTISLHAVFVGLGRI